MALWLNSLARYQSIVIAKRWLLISIKSLKFLYIIELIDQYWLVHCIVINNALNISKSTLHRWTKKEKLGHSTMHKSLCWQANKKARVKFFFFTIDELKIGLVNHTKPTFIDMYNYIHIDEKWFYMTKTTERIMCTLLKLIYYAFAKANDSFRKLCS